MNHNQFLTKAHTRWTGLHKKESLTYQVGLDMLAIVGQFYQQQPLTNLHLTVQALEGQMGKLHMELLEERTLAIKRATELAQLRQQLKQVETLQKQLAQVREQETSRLLRWITESENAGLFSGERLLTLLGHLRQRYSRLAQSSVASAPAVASAAPTPSVRLGLAA